VSAMTKAAVLERGSGPCDEGGSREAQGVERPRAIAPDDHVPGLEILHRATSGVKFNREIIVGSELAHICQILNKIWGNQNIIKM
jgi:hypothetical protein